MSIQTIANVELATITGGGGPIPDQSKPVGSPERCAWLPQGIAQHDANEKQLDVEAKGKGVREWLSLHSRASYELTNAMTLRKELDSFCSN